MPAILTQCLDDVAHRSEMLDQQGHRAQAEMGSALGHQQAEIRSAGLYRRPFEQVYYVAGGQSVFRVR